jgi:hypothetical protein
MAETPRGRNLSDRSRSSTRWRSRTIYGHEQKPLEGEQTPSRAGEKAMGRTEATLCLEQRRGERDQPFSLREDQARNHTWDPLADWGKAGNCRNIDTSKRQQLSKNRTSETQRPLTSPQMGERQSDRGSDAHEYDTISACVLCNQRQGKKDQHRQPSTPN